MIFNLILCNDARDSLVQVLDLSFNVIQSDDISSFLHSSQLPNLTFLDLSFNRLARFSTEGLIGERLRVLNLSANHIAALDIHRPMTAMQVKYWSYVVVDNTKMI